MSWNIARAGAVACASTWLLLALGCSSREPASAAQPQVAATGPRLYVLDCGTISPMDPALFSVKKEEVAGDVSFASPCYLVVHPKGTLVWEAGQVPDAKVKDDGTEAVEQDILKATRQLSTQLAALGHPVDSIDFLAMSHYHADHTANANAFAKKSTWIVQQAEYDMMFREGSVDIRSPETYGALKEAKRVTLNNEDHDVFGDGTVVVKTAPGHTPGHQMLFLRLAHFGPLLLEGDLYHLPEERSLDRVPTFDFDAAMTRATRVKVEQFLKETGAQMWIQHDPPTYAMVKKAPEYYD